jgi:hypothetical protein
MPMVSSTVVPQDELAATRREIAHLTTHLETHPGMAWEGQLNILNRLDHLRTDALGLEALIEASDERTARLIAAALRIGDSSLTALAYLVYGPTAIGIEALHRLGVTHDGFTRSDSVHVNVLAADVPAVREELEAFITKVADIWAGDPADYRIETVAL